MGITGSPGVGKSTFIEALGSYLISTGYRVAVLAIDPSSRKTKGSILGDKTRMETLAKSPNAYIRPSATGNTLGGIAKRTRETMLLCEAAGYDIILIETVGVGQSETAVRSIVDFLLLLLLPGAGDDLQGIKRGIVEIADAMMINKADGDGILTAKNSMRAYKNALALYPQIIPDWTRPVLMGSSIQKLEIDTIWHTVEKFFAATQKNKYLQQQRKKQRILWFEEQLVHEMMTHLQNKMGRRSDLKEVRSQVAKNKLSPGMAVKMLVEKLDQNTLNL